MVNITELNCERIKTVKQKENEIENEMETQINNEESDRFDRINENKILIKEKIQVENPLLEKRRDILDEEEVRIEIENNSNTTNDSAV